MTCKWWLSLALVAAFSITEASAGDGAAKPSEEVLANGRAIAQEHCARCHGVEASDRSKHGQAPTFREIANRYSVWLLAESLAEGIVSGHPDMPEFVFDPDQINEILSYMDSLKTKTEDVQ